MYYVDVDLILTNLPRFMSEYDVTDDELAWLLAMANNGQEQEAIDLLMEGYINAPTRKYQKDMSYYMGKSGDDIIEPSSLNSVARHISVYSVALAGLLVTNFRKFIRSAYSDVVFERAGITDKDVKRNILNSIISGYETSINGAMAQTQSFVINGIRDLQRDMVVYRAMMDKSQLTKTALDAEVKRFKENLRSKYPNLYRAIEEGSILASRKYGPDGETVRHFKLDYYADMATRSTILNVDRASNTISAIMAGERVVEYILADNRNVKREREICKDILNKKIFGMSVLALDNEAATILGVMTLDEARSTPDFAMGPFCRHIPIRIDGETLKEFDKLLRVA